MATAVTEMTSLSFPVLVTLAFPPTANGQKFQQSFDMVGMIMLLFQSPMPWPRRFATKCLTVPKCLIFIKDRNAD